MIRRLLYKPFFIKLLNWEYWPFHLVYTPVYIYWMWLALKSRSFFFFSTANPSIRNSGFLLESKKEIYDLIPPEHYPATLFFKAGTSLNEVKKDIKIKGMQYPLVAKPDIGMQGLAVKKMADENELTTYINASRFDFLVQEFIAYENEVGIFYYRYPDKEDGKISGMVQKEFLTVTGNGDAAIEQLLKHEKRFILQLKTLRQEGGIDLHVIPRAGEKIMLVPYGNHVRGAKFLDASDLINAKLTNSINKICKKLEGFYYGRLDIRYKSWEELVEGKNFSIIELNGAGSEPTHIYDPKHSVFFAWKEIIRHLNILARISRINHKKSGLTYMKFSEGMKLIRENGKYITMLKGFREIV